MSSIIVPKCSLILPRWSRGGVVLPRSQRGFMLVNPSRFGPSGPADPNFSSVVLLCHMEGSNGGATFTDSSASAHSCTALTGTSNSNAQVQFGSTSCFITGTDSGGLSIGATLSDFNFGLGDFTIEGWGYASNVSTRLNLIFDCRAGGTGVALFVGGGASFGVTAGSVGAASNTAVMATGAGAVANSWVHYALTRQGTTLRGFAAGVQAFSVTDSRTYSAPTTVYIGRDNAGSSFQGFGGYLDEVRVTKGVARYTANFTPPTAAFPDH
jgi:hypothetical protein